MLWTADATSAILQRMDAYRREVGRRLEQLRHTRNWSQEDAAHAVGVTISSWGRWERGTTSPYDSNWKRIAAIFGEDAARHARGTPPALTGESLEVQLAAMRQQISEIHAALLGDGLAGAADRLLASGGLPPSKAGGPTADFSPSFAAPSRMTAATFRNTCASASVIVRLSSLLGGVPNRPWLLYFPAGRA